MFVLKKQKNELSKCDSRDQDYHEELLSQVTYIRQSHASMTHPNDNLHTQH